MPPLTFGFLDSFLPLFSSIYPSCPSFFCSFNHSFVQSLVRLIVRSFFFVCYASFTGSSVNRSFVYNRSFTRSIVRWIFCSITRPFIRSFVVQSFVHSFCVFISKQNNIREYSVRVWPCVGHRAILVYPLVESLMAKIWGSDPKLREAEHPTNLSDSSSYPSALFLRSDTKQMSSFHFLAV